MNKLILMTLQDKRDLVKKSAHKKMIHSFFSSLIENSQNESCLGSIK